MIAHPSKGQSPILFKVGLDPETLDSRYNKRRISIVSVAYCEPVYSDTQRLVASGYRYSRVTTTWCCNQDFMKLESEANWNVAKS